MRWRVALVALAALAAWLPTPPRLVERWYSNAAYAALQRPLTAVSNTLPFALFDVLLVAVAGGWLVLAARDLTHRRGYSRPVIAGRLAMRTLASAAILYLVFLLVWGLNYRRVPLVEKLAFDAHAVTVEAARSLALTAVERLNALYAPAHASGWPPAGEIDRPLAAAFSRAERQIGNRVDVTVGRPKHTLLDWYFRRTAVDGMTDPYFLETLLSTSLLPFERPFVTAHEWSHLAGLADEGDANFLGWLACVQSEPPEQYSAWLFLYGEMMGSLARPVRSDLAARLDDGPRADLAAIRARVYAQVNPRLSQAGWKVYDQYLKANRVEAGAESYAHVVRLVLGVRFDPGWVLRPPVATP